MNAQNIPSNILEAAALVSSYMDARFPGDWELAGIQRRVASTPQQHDCDMGDMCVGCEPRNADGSCPDQQPAAEAQADARMDQLRKFVEWERMTQPGKTHIAEWALYELRRLRVAPPAEAWQKGYRQGVLDERTSEANIGIAGFGAKVEPARNNPYVQQPAAVDEFADDRDRLIRAFMMECGIIGVKEAGVNLARGIKAALAAQPGGAE